MTRINFSAVKKHPKKVNVKFSARGGKVSFTAEKKNPRDVKVDFHFGAVGISGRYVCNACGRVLHGEAAPSIEEEIRMLLFGGVIYEEVKNKAWFVTAENRKMGTAYCVTCMHAGKAK